MMTFLVDFIRTGLVCSVATTTTTATAALFDAVC